MTTTLGAKTPCRTGYTVAQPAPYFCLLARASERAISPPSGLHQASLQLRDKGSREGWGGEGSDPGLIWVGVLSSSDGPTIKDKLLPVLIFSAGD